MILIDLIVGARPNFVKIAPIIEALKEKENQGSNLRYRLIHTGQHYDKRLSDSFFIQLQIPEPDFNLGAGSGTQAEQTSSIMLGYEKVLNIKKCDLCIVVGDVTSTMACAIVAKKNNILVAHVEAGIRSGDWNMPEEINRVVTDSISDLFFTTSKNATDNLIQNGVKPNSIFFVGNTMIDTLLKNINNFKPTKIWYTENLENEKYLVLTLHRPSNVDNDKALYDLVNIISENTLGIKIIFPVHPRISNRVNKLLTSKNIVIIEPQGYFEFNFLVKNSIGVITDSGGVTEETTVMGIPCITLRENTERPETVSLGTNELVGSDKEKIITNLKKMINGQWKQGKIPELWDGDASVRIINIIDNYFSNV
jgi:UDP-N-acetylglucosamine 2-epimerase (non-hydrolysing)